MAATSPYLVALLFFTQTEIATEERLAAGIEGYKVRAEAARKNAISSLESRIATDVQSLAAAKKGRVIATMVGTGTDELRAEDGSWQFATASDRANRILWLNRELDELRQLAAGIKAKKIYPQIRAAFKTPGGAGCFPGGIFPTAIREGEVKAFAILEDFEYPKECVFETLEREDAIIREGLELRGVYQFVSTRAGMPVFRHVKEIGVGSSKCLFNERGEFHKIPHTFTPR